MTSTHTSIERLSPDKIASIQAQISQTETQIDTLNDQINELNRATHNALEQKKAKLDLISSLRDVLSPIRRIPVDVLAEIFEDVCLSKDGLERGEKNVLMRSVLVRVCVSWKTLLYAMPRIWAKLDISYHAQTKFVQGNSRLIRDWLGRAQGYPLDIKVKLSSYDSTKDTLDAILSFRHQIRSLELGGRSGSFLPLFELPPSSFPSLEKLILIFMDAITPSFHCNAFLGAKNLREVEIVDYWPRVSMLHLADLPVERLTTVDIAAMDPKYDLAVYVDMLRRCTNLTRLAFCIPFPSNPNLAGFTPNLSITLPSLKTLDITCYTPTIASPLSCFTLPVLEDLILQWQGQDYHSLYMDIVGLKNRSMTSLKSLTLGHFMTDNIFTKEMTSILSILPELTSFSIDGCTTFGLDPLIRALTYTKGQPVLLPKLTKFGFYPFENQGYPPSMMDMVFSRLWSDTDEGWRTGLTQLKKFALPRSLAREKISASLPGLVVDFD